MVEVEVEVETLVLSVVRVVLVVRVECGPLKMDSDGLSLVKWVAWRGRSGVKVMTVEGETVGDRREVTSENAADAKGVAIAAARRIEALMLYYLEMVSEKEGRNARKIESIERNQRALYTSV